MQLPAPTNDVVPGAQSRQDSIDLAASAAEYFPLTHATHADDDIASKVGEYFPAGQDAHDVKSDVTEYLPAPHDSHTVSDEGEQGVFTYFPAGHVAQSLQYPVLVPLHPDLKLFAGHVKLEQSVHVPASSPVHATDQ